MSGAALVGAAFGLGVALVVSGLWPAPEPLAAALDRLHRPWSRPSLEPGQPRLSIWKRAGDAVAQSDLGRRIIERCRSDLRITGTTPGEHVATRCTMAIGVFLWGPVLAAVAWAAGVHLGVALPLWLAIALAPVGFLLPGLQLKARAAQRRRTFRHALSAFLDIVSISLASGRGVDSSLHAGAEAGGGWAFGALRAALAESQLLGEPPWAALGRLGEELEVAELVELSASAALAGAEGARVRVSLAAKARSLRLRGLADVETAAQAASERMTLPVGGLMLAFVVFLGYPAVVKVLQGL